MSILTWRLYTKLYIWLLNQNLNFCDIFSEIHLISFCLKYHVENLLSQWQSFNSHEFWILRKLEAIFKSNQTNCSEILKVPLESQRLIIMCGIQRKVKVKNIMWNEFCVLLLSLFCALSMGFLLTYP